MPAPGGFPAPTTFFTTSETATGGAARIPTHRRTFSTTMNPETIEAMIRFGGNFVRSLGQAALAADPENRRRIAAAWPELIAKYSAMAEPGANATG